MDSDTNLKKKSKAEIVTLRLHPQKKRIDLIDLTESESDGGYRSNKKKKNLNSLNSGKQIKWLVQTCATDKPTNNKKPTVSKTVSRERSNSVCKQK